MTHPAADAPADPPARRGRQDPFRWIIEHPATVDGIAFGAAALLLLIGSLGTGSIGWWTLFTVPMFATGALCRVRPGTGVIVIAILAVLHVAVNIPVVLGDVLTFYALFCAVAYGRPLVHAAGVAAGFAGVLVQATFWGLNALAYPYGSVMAAAASFFGLILVGSITVTAVWALANLQRARVRQLALVRERAEQAVREREQRTALAVADERARIAREMHDVVAHSLSVIIAQADGGRFVASQQPAKAADVLTTIGETGRTALADMRSLLGVLRQEDETTFGPQPGPEMLPDLLERVRGAGLEVDLDVDGELEDLSQAMGMSLFRLVQEALTNVLKHAGPRTSVAVHITRGPQQIEVSIIDDGQGTDPASDGQGHGITGMRERMGAFGGTLQAGPLPGRGFRVLATLPLPATSLAAADDDAPSSGPDTGPGPGPGPGDQSPRSPYTSPSVRSPYGSPASGSEGDPR